MSKTRARSTESYENEARFHESAAHAVQQAGFRSVAIRKEGSIKIVEGTTRDGSKLTFWLKVGWSDVPYAAVQFGLFKGPDGASKTNAEFVRFVDERVNRMKERGITHALLVHRDTFALALRIEDVAAAYREQMRRFPSVARNTKSPTMWIYDPRPGGNAEVAAIVFSHGIPLDVLAARASTSPTDKEVRARMAEVEMRVMQAAFRYRVGERCGWRCVVTGCSITAILDSAHLPGRDWRKNNDATDGILLRADIHRLLDCGLAHINNGKFEVTEQAMDEYAEFHGRSLTS